MNTLIVILSIIILILNTILFFKIWGMCNNVRDIKNAYLLRQSNIVGLATESTPANDTQQENNGCKFNVGQLVIVKTSEDQFRVSSIENVNGVNYYFSEKFKKSFPEFELEDFDIYWGKKKA